MRVISFDVGIKNMAYCILDVSSNIVIKDWTIMNLMAAEIPKHICNCSTTTKSKKNPITKPCTQLAKYKKNETYYCDKHAKSKTDCLIPSKQFTSTYLKKQKIPTLIELGKKFGIENLDQQKKEKIVDTLVGFFEARCYENITVIKSKTAGETDLIQIGRNMRDQLDSVCEVGQIQCVVIENQISPIANRMKTIQGMLAQYFIMKIPDCSIEFVSSINKLKQFSHLEKPDKPILENTIAINTYKNNKKNGIFYCQKIVDINTNLSGSQLFAESPSKKKDDLADCFLQGLWYLKQKNIITYADDLKINIVLLS
jgi:hypothetical protein